jgi:hypothetical protein
VTGNVSKQPAVGTPLSIVCKTPAGNVLIGVTIEVIGLRKKVTEEKGATSPVRGQNDHVISAQEIADTRDFQMKQDPSRALPEGECLLNITALAPAATKLGPNAAPFVAGAAAVRQIRFKKDSQEFGPKTPLEMTLIHECLFNFTIDPAILRKRVRNLTIEEAYKELVHRHKAGTIRLIPEPVFDAACTPQVQDVSLPRHKTVKETNAEGKEITRTEPVTGPDGKPLSVTTKLVNMDPRVGTIKLLYNAFPSRGSKGGASDILNVNPINAAGLVRLCLMLQRRFNITEFHHIGVGRNVVVNKGDCHDWGRAIDFGGVRLPDPVPGKPPLLLTLQEDWAKESVPKVAQIGQRPSRDDRSGAWPTEDRNLEFRFLSLNADFDPAGDAKEQARVVARALADNRVAQSLKQAFNTLNDPKRKPKATPAELDAARTPLLAERKSYVTLARTFFQFFFNWASDNYSQSSADPDPSPTDAPESPDQPPPPSPPPVPPDTPMGNGGRIMHPDHHDTNTSGTPPQPDPNAKNGREAHNGHFHIQIGPTHGSTGAEPVIP